MTSVEYGNGQTKPATAGKTNRQLASPPASPRFLPTLTEDDLRNGLSLDFVKEFGLEKQFESELNGSNGAFADNGNEASTSSEKDEIYITGFSDGEAAGDTQGSPNPRIHKTPSERLHELASSRKNPPKHASLETAEEESDDLIDPVRQRKPRAATGAVAGNGFHERVIGAAEDEKAGVTTDRTIFPVQSLLGSPPPNIHKDVDHHIRPLSASRTVSTPHLRRRVSAPKGVSSNRPAERQQKDVPPALRFGRTRPPSTRSAFESPEASPMPRSIPMPPLSMPTYLQLEMSSERPSPMYIHRSVTSDFPYESSRVKIERLKNFMLLPPQLEATLWFGALACMDAWLFSFTILPLRFLKALSILGLSWARNITKESRYIADFIYSGSRRMWDRRKRGSLATSTATACDPGHHANHPKVFQKEAGERIGSSVQVQSHRKSRNPSIAKHRRSKSTPSALSPDHKADILKGLLILLSCTILMYFDASRMYHGIRGQDAIKLYVIYNVLEVCDRLFSALGQDVLECLFSKETLERKADGRSKVARPFWLFLLALVYNLVHSTALFYQVITLNVAVNSYSNALLTLLLSNQFVEIKSTVFKKFEKENLFQLTCADVVERFQLWLMLMIIALRNIIETGGLNFMFAGDPSDSETVTSPHTSTLPRSFTLFPSWTGQVLAPFFLVLGSEMLVDWLKHAYITKFNNTKPAIYGRFLDVLAKDYYSNAFADQNLTRRLGLPVLPLACLFIRASVQTYHMFLATHMPPPIPSTATALSVESATTSPSTTAALAHIDQLLRRALYSTPSTSLSPSNFLDILLPYLLPLTTILLVFLFLLSVKLLLGMVLLSFARSRYRTMKERENTGFHAEGRRVGGWGMVEVDEDKRRWIYADDAEGARRMRERETNDRDRSSAGAGENFGGVERYNMVAKRIW